MEVGKAIVYRIGPIYLERASEMIEIMLVKEPKCVHTALTEWESRDFLVAFTNLLTEIYEDKYKAKVEEISRLQEMIETYKKQGWRTEDEEKKLKALEEKATEYALKRDFLKKLVEDFKKMFYYD
jgi:DNA-binding transcriptional regulator GbsR (MarR family)